MNLVGEVSVYTATLTGPFIVPAGARTIDLNNRGAGTATYTGDRSELSGKTKNAVNLASQEAYSFGDVGKPYPAITIDATGTEVDITVNY